jgi:hypothetical protein
LILRPVSYLQSPHTCKWDCGTGFMLHYASPCILLSPPYHLNTYARAGPSLLTFHILDTKYLSLYVGKQWTSMTCSLHGLTVHCLFISLYIYFILLP